MNTLNFVSGMADLDVSAHRTETTSGRQKTPQRTPIK